MRIGPSHPWLGAVGFHLALPLLEFIYRQQAIYRSGSRFARARVRAIKDKIERGETAYLAGVSSAGIHNSGVALVEVTRNGPRLLFNNEEERFSAVKHTNKYQQMAIAALRAAMAGMGLDIKNIDAWFSSWDYAALAATLIRSLLEELSVNICMTKGDPTGLFNLRDFDRGSRTHAISLNNWD
jgi:carbamoyltransferase